MVRVRIAPSPTGFAHVGTAYTAMFNYAFARKNKGKFIIRIEDTDVKRHVKEAEKAIYGGLSWLGIDWDEGPDKSGKYGPYRQSEKLGIYKDIAYALIKKGMAYKEGRAIRFKNPGKRVSWNDLIKGKISFSGGQITDFVILKSDGYPTYNFAAVVDDLAMKISHVIRGEEHVSNTPRQIAIYRALEEKPPEFAHNPTLRNKKRQKLSKRRDPVDLGLYKEKGFLPEALVNYLCLLGWSHPDEKEIFDLNEFVKLFSLDRVRKAGPIFDMTKLEWMNGEYIRAADNEELVSKIYGFYNKKYSKEKIGEIVPLIKDRIKTLGEFDSLAGFFFKSSKIDKGMFGKESKKHLKQAFDVLEKVGKWEKKEIDNALLNLIKKEKFHTGKFFMDLRIAITGSKVTPPINDSIIILGKEETIKRLKKTVD